MLPDLAECLRVESENAVSFGTTVSQRFSLLLPVSLWHGILFEEPNPTGSRPRDLLLEIPRSKTTSRDERCWESTLVCIKSITLGVVLHP